MNKKAQFYFLAIILLAAIFIGFVTISNKTVYTGALKLSHTEASINSEISSLLDYFSREQISDSTQKTILTDFSVSYINEIGIDKDVFFIFGKFPTVTLSGNRVTGTNLSVNTGSGDIYVNNVGIFQTDYTLSGTNVTKVSLDGVEYNFTFYSGQNVYYLLKAVSNNQTFISSGGTLSSQLIDYCNDGVFDNGEEGLDCGGSRPNECEYDTCNQNSLQDNGETGVDCGGGICPPCDFVGV